MYSSPSLGRLWKKVHLACSPFLRRPAVRRLYQKPAPQLLKLLRGPYSLIALGCADGTKEALLLQKLPKPAYLLAADTNLSLARRAARRLPALKKAACQIDLTTHLPSAISHLPQPLLLTLFGVLPNLDPLPLLRRVAKTMRPGDLLLFSANLAPGRSGFAGARKVLSQYDNPATRRWLESAIQAYRPKLPKGRLQFGVHPDPRQKSLARIEARWIAPKKTVTVFSSRRPTTAQVETWIRSARLRRLSRFLDPRGEEAVWLVRSAKT
ncbi:MAG: hypothetical protein ACKODZ_08130 [Verrucomicrobiota bacterium]